MEITKRQEKILYSVVRLYTESAEPVGSKVLQEQHFRDISSATVRNELAALEDSGYLVQPHTSSGRIPTEQGYQHYINKLMNIYSMTSKEKAMIDYLSKSLESDMKTIMDTTLGVMSTMVNNVSICQSSFADDVLGKLRLTLSDDFSNNLQVKGLSCVLSQPEFEGVENLKPLLDIVDNKSKLEEVFEGNNNGEVNIKIGSDIGIEELKECAVVSKKVEYHNQPIMSLGVIGPMRMRYAKAISVLDEVAQVIDHALEEVL